MRWTYAGLCFGRHRWLDCWLGLQWTMQFYHPLQLPLIRVGRLEQAHWLRFFGAALCNCHTCFAVSAKRPSDEQFSVLTGALFLRFLLHWWRERNPPLLGTPVQRTHRFCTMPRLRQRTLALHHSRIAHGILLRQSFLLSLHIHGLSHPPLDNRSDLFVVVTFLLAHFHLAWTVDSWLTWSVLRTEAVASTWRSSCNHLL